MIKAKIDPKQLTIGMRVSYYLGKYRRVVTGDIVEMRRVLIGKDNTNQKYSMRVKIGTRWVNASQLFREVDTSLILE